MEALIPMVAILSIFVILPGMAMYFADRRRRWHHERETGSTNGSAELLALADKMERRIEALEQILDAESPGWRQKYHERS